MPWRCSALTRSCSSSLTGSSESPLALAAIVPVVSASKTRSGENARRASRLDRVGDETGRSMADRALLLVHQVASCVRRPLGCPAPRPAPPAEVVITRRWFGTNRARSRISRRRTCCFGWRSSGSTKNLRAHEEPREAHASARPLVERDDSLLRQKADLLSSLEKSRRDVLDARAELRQIEEQLATLPRLEETLERFREAGLEERLKEQSLLVREERVLASIPERLSPFQEFLESLKREIPIDRVFLSAKALVDLPGKEILTHANGVFEQLERDLEHIAKEPGSGLAPCGSRGCRGCRAEWETRKKNVQTAYEKILRELQKSRIDGEEFHPAAASDRGLRPLRGAAGSCTARGEGAVCDAGRCWPNGKTSRLGNSAAWTAPRRRLMDSCATRCRSKSRRRVTVSLYSGSCATRSEADCLRPSRACAELATSPSPSSSRGAAQGPRV